MAALETDPTLMNVKLSRNKFEWRIIVVYGTVFIGSRNGLGSFNTKDISFAHSSVVCTTFHVFNANKQLFVYQLLSAVSISTA